MPKRFVYNDMFTGETVVVKPKGGELTPMEKFWEKGNYRHSSKLERKAGLECSRCKNLSGHNKCQKVGVTDSTASDINREFVCDFFKPMTGE